MTLSPRHCEIVDLIGREGLSYKAIAKRLGIAVKTVKAHVYTITAKLDSTRRPREAIIEYYHDTKVGDAIKPRVTESNIRLVEPRS